MLTNFASDIEQRGSRKIGFWVIWLHVIQAMQLGASYERGKTFEVVGGAENRRVFGKSAPSMLPVTRPRAATVATRGPFYLQLAS